MNPSRARTRPRPTGLAALVVVLAVTWASVACSADDADDAATTSGSGGTAATAEATTVRLLTHDSFDVSDEVLEAFTAETGIRVEILRGGDAVSVVNQAILTAGDPEADVLFGIDDNLLTAAAEAELFEPVDVDLDGVPEELRVGPDHDVVPIDRGDVCVNYDRAGLADRGLEPPSSLAELADERYAGLLVVEDPSTSTPGLAFLAATVAAERAGDLDGTWQELWEDLVDNDVVVVDGWEQAYYGEFSGPSGEGNRPLVVSYASSPPVEVVFSADYEATGELPDEAPTGVVEGTCIRQVEYAGVLAGTDHPEAAAALVELLLSPAFQAEVPDLMFVYPVLDGIELPEVFTRFSAVPADPYRLSPDEVGAERADWVETWTSIVLG